MADLKLEVLFNAVDKLSGPIKTIVGGSKTLSDAFKKTSSELKALEAQQRKISGFRQLKEQSEKTAQAIEQNKETLKQLKTAMNIGAPTEQMVKDLARAEAAQKRLKAAQKNQGSEMTALVRELNQAGISVDNLADDESELKNKIHLTTMEINKQKESLERHQKAQKQYEQMQGRMAKASDLAKKGLAIGAVGTAGMAYTLKQYEDAEDAAMGLRVSMMQANGQVSKEYAEINKLANGLGTKLPGTTADFQNMMAVLIQQGISAKAILGGVGEAAGYLGVQMKMPFADAAEFAAKMQDATKTTEKDMLGLMDVIQRSYYLGVDSGNMLQGFAKISAGMKTIKAEGLEGAKAIAPLLVMADQAAMAGEAAGNAYSKIFKSMMDTKGIAKALKDSGTGIQMNFTDGKGEFGGLDKMFKQLEKLKGLSTEARLPILSDMFGNDAETIQALNLLIDKGQTGYNEVVAKMQKQADLQTRVNAQLSTLKNLKDAASGTFTSMLALFGEQLAPQFKILITGFTNVTESVTTWAHNNPELANTIAKVVAGGILLVGGLSALSLGLITVFGPMMLVTKGIGMIGGGFGLLAGGFLKLFTLAKFAGTGLLWIGRALLFAGQQALIAMGRLYLLAIRGIGMLAQGIIMGAVRGASLLGQSLLFLGRTALIAGRFMLANPIILVAMAIAGAAYLIYKNWEPIKGFFVGIWNTVKTAFNGGITGVSALIINWSPIGLFYAAFAKVLSWFGVDLPAKFTGFGAMILTGLKNGIMSKIGEVKAALSGAVTGVIDKARNILGIHSPSRVFMGIGDYTMQGMALGISQNHNLPVKATQQATQNVIGTGTTAKVTPVTPIRAQRGGSYISNDTIQITIKAEHGQPVRETARALRAEMVRLQQEERDARRRFLTDTE
ncbi:phage tail tape measure protein [Acinetobacter baumannii]|uniref:phage tail tape measure protein n=1 Tax=Acinetobacter calcoaceticus/baumannii complex TaxID=909768 RepID=UPI000A3335CF|nr:MULTISPECIES: phage tail tape measure protein [Acinetobacter calcoaceticus/baumannii complex]EHU1747761.1 phage tail tape measure protein [Acinetobacter baumannii]EHU1800843.1 phage tail tape measure protein [Acinetobacter baumannii]EHU1952083.1 phage tail tape measure protein [Acinetobacter baumannii]MDV7707663.1 phage tail tape measure protein [Acinetobacter pittii]MDV7762114.1 phage tail tape measure protein [Acinetobacter pittii]